jgi:hypothetical protein
MPSNPAYHAFIDEAFIKPIRSVLIVDDDYPTYSEVLDRQAVIAEGKTPSASTKRWLTAPLKIKKVIDSFRKQPLIVDIHDGRGGEGDEAALAYHLHQSDLLVLDYQLDGANGDGTRAIDIARSVMANNHFNLVVVHTTAKLREAFNEMLLGLMSPCMPAPKGNAAERSATLLAKAELDLPDILKDLHDAFKVEQYFRVRKDPATAFRSFLAGEQPFLSAREFCRSAAWEGANLRIMFDRALRDFEESSVKKMVPSGKGSNLHWNEETLWIRSNSGFIAFTDKTDEDVDILKELSRSLIAWSPKPSRLFLTKLRSTLGELGVAAEDAALGNDYVLARWYSQLLKGDDYDRRSLIGAAVARHSEQLLDFVQDNVLEFAERLVKKDSEGPTTGNDLVKEHFRIDLADPESSDRADRDHNIFACTKKPQGWHLQTGHIFKAADALWVCLSPSCDLVPEQRKTGYFKELGTQLPFLAVKLKPWPKTEQPLDVQTNRYVFLEVEGGKPQILCINEPEAPNSSPHWYPLHAANLGRLDDQRRFHFTKVETDGGKIVLKEHEATVVAQLRYEYAINLAQMMGANFTRVGLDFIGPDRIA